MLGVMTREPPVCEVTATSFTSQLYENCVPKGHVPKDTLNVEPIELAPSSTGDDGLT
jgi:hypothetical protein